MLQTRLTRRYAVEVPIVQAGMAFVAGPRLAIAVCRSGGIGSLGVGLMPPPAFVPAVAAVREAVGKAAFNANLLTPFVTDEVIAAMCDAAPPIVSFHWGHPQRRWIDRLTTAGCSVWEQVGGVEAARRAAGDGIELVIAQGSEAGGHNYGSLPIFALVPEVADAIGRNGITLLTSSPSGATVPSWPRAHADSSLCGNGEAATSKNLTCLGAR